jgi:cold shock CspA family protein
VRRPSTGVVSAIDPGRGLGEVTDEAGHVLPFHCTAVADGSRQIAVGTAVCFVVVPGRLGRLEARGLVPANG